jgi:Ca-activated chloride channel family protein
VLDLARALSPQIMPKEGDDLAGALALAGRALAGSADGGSILIMADAVSPEEVAALAGAKRMAATLLALLPPGTDAGALSDAARAIGAVLVPSTIDQDDVDAVVRRLDSRDAAASIAGDGTHWREAGYWLVPLLALLTLLWFRRGWVLA